jgi:hypothetical protein
MLWPINHTWYISGADLFRAVARQRFLSGPSILENLTAVVQEIAILAPILLALWLIRVKALAGLSSEVTGGDQTAQ